MDPILTSKILMGSGVGLAALLGYEKMSPNSYLNRKRSENAQIYKHRIDLESLVPYSDFQAKTEHQAAMKPDMGKN